MKRKLFFFTILEEREVERWKKRRMIRGEIEFFKLLLVATVKDEQMMEEE